MLPIWYMFFGFRVNVFLGQSKIYNVYNMLFFIALAANQEVLWLDISVNEILWVYVFHSGKLKEKKQWWKYSKEIYLKNTLHFLLSTQGFNYWNENKTHFFFTTQSHFIPVNQKIFSDTYIYITNIKIKEWGSTVEIIYSFTL